MKTDSYQEDSDFEDLLDDDDLARLQVSRSPDRHLRGGGRGAAMPPGDTG